MKNYSTILLLLVFSARSVAQNHYADKKAVVFEEMYNDPYDINKLFIGIQPLYAELFSSNVTAGFGLEAHYFHKDKFDVRGNFRRPWVGGFYDLSRDQAEKVSQSENIPKGFSFFEIAFNYHLQESTVESKTSMVLFRKSYKDAKWASRVPLRTTVPASARKIIGIRGGSYTWASALNVSNIMRLQGTNLSKLETIEGTAMATTIISSNNQSEAPSLFSNITSVGFFVGTSLTKIRNIAIDFEEYDPGTDDSIISLYFDILYSPLMTIDPIEFLGQEYHTGAITMTNIGVRLGIDGKFNRTLAWAYGGEIGYRPSVTRGTFVVQFKLAMPVFGTKLENTLTKVTKFE